MTTITGQPVTVTPGSAPVQLRPPAGPSLLAALVLANQSPYLVGVAYGTSQFWLAPWASDQYVLDPDSNSPVTVTAQPMPGLTQPAGTSAVVLPTWSEGVIPGTYPATLGQQATLAAGTQRIVAQQTVTWPSLSNTQRVQVPLTACDRSILVYLNALAAGEWVVSAELSGPTTGAIYAQDLLGFPVGGLVEQFRAMPAYGTADPTVNLDLTLETLTGGTVPFSAELIVIALPDALLGGRQFDPLDVVALNGPPFIYDPSLSFSGTGNLASAVVFPAAGADQVLWAVTSAVSTGIGGANAGRWHLAYGASTYVANGQLGLPCTGLGIYLPTSLTDCTLNISGLGGTDTWQLTVIAAQAVSTG